MITIRRAVRADVPDIMTIMTEAHEAMADGSAYITDDREYVEDHLERAGFILLAEMDGQPAGFFMIETPGLGERNPGHYLDFSEEQMKKVAIMDSVAVSPKCQGHGLMRALIREVMTMTAEDYPYLFGTVAPDNYPSRNSFEACGFRACREVIKPAGQKRLLMALLREGTEETGPSDAGTN